MEIDHQKILEILPQSPPFVMIDRVVEFEKGKSLTAVKNITGNEWIFANQEYPGNVFPETLIIEAAAQAALILYHLSMISVSDIRPKYILSRLKSEFFIYVRVGDQITVYVYATKMVKSGGIGEIEIKIKDELVSNLSLIFKVER